MIDKDIEGTEDIGICIECGGPIDWEGDGGFLWEGLTFCDQHDPKP